MVGDLARAVAQRLRTHDLRPQHGEPEAEDDAHADETTAKDAPLAREVALPLAGHALAHFLGLRHGSSTRGARARAFDLVTSNTSARPERR